MMSPTSLGHYRIDVRIGQGGMGEVFRAFDTRLNRPVAIKIMRTSAGNTDASVQRFLREARAASALNHPNIVIIHEVGESPDGDHFIVQEFIDGRTLRSMLPGPLGIETLVHVGGQVARALAAAHAAGIVHRDVKPENIMVRQDGYVKVLDFGLARMNEATETVDATRTNYDTAPGTLVGTPAYLSPEQASGRGVTAAADVFALGVVLYEMIAGRRPFVGMTALGLLTSIVTEQPPPVTRVNPAAPGALDDLLQQMLEKQPERRPTALDVARRLAVLLSPGLSAVVSVAAGPASATVGRERERAELLRAFQRVASGRSLMVGVSGEPGIGKTSLVEDVLHVLEQQPDRPIVARGRCSESLAGAEAYLPVLEALDSLVHRTSGPSLDSVIRTVAPSWHRQVSSYSSEQVASEGREPAPAVSQERMKRELGALLQELSRRQPLVLFIEDLHWADVSTVDILNYLSGRFADMRVLIVATYRPSDMALVKHPFLGVRGTLLAKGALEEIALGFLTEPDVRTYLDLLFPGHAFPPDFAATVHAKTEGSPLFMADLVRYLRDTGGIVEEGGRWRLARALPDAPRDLPASVRGMITSKIDQLDEADRRLLLAASVQGHEFDSATAGDAIEMAAAEVEERLEALERVHVFVRRGDELEFPDRTLTLRYQFVHVLYQNVLFASLQPTRRASLCGRIARQLATHYGDEAHTIASRLAVLFEGARDFASAAHYFFLAARRAVGIFGFREALSLADRGLDGLRGLPAGAERLQQELGLQMVRGLALRSVKGWAAPELETTFGRARQICQQLGDAPQLFPVMWNLTFFNMIRGELPVVREQIAVLRTQAEASEAPAFHMAVDHLAGVTAEFGGDTAESHRLLEHSRELHDPAEHKVYHALFGIDPGMVARVMSSRPLLALGYPDQARDRALESLAIARRLREPVTLGFAMIVAEGVHAFRGESAEALALWDEASALCREYQFPQEMEWARAFQGAALTAADRIDEAVDALRQSLGALEALRSGLVRTMWLSLLADALLRAGRITGGLEAIEEAFAHGERTREHGFYAELCRLRADASRRQGHIVSAEADLRRAIEYAHAQQGRLWELRAATALARLLADSGRAAEARTVLPPVYAWFSEGFDTADLRAARAVLAQID